MKTFYVLLIVTSLLACSSSQKAANQAATEPTYAFTLTLQVKGAFCGGAAPDHELLTEIQRAKPYANAKVFLRAGTLNEWGRPADLELISNQEGIAKGRLPVGDYAVVFEDKSGQEAFDVLMERYGEETQSYGAIDETCLRNHFIRPAALLKVTPDGSNELTLIYQEKCSWQKVPCAAYKGNLPP